MGLTGKNTGHIPDHHCQWLSTSESESESEVVGTKSKSVSENMEVVSEKKSGCEHKRVRVNEAW